MSAVCMYVCMYAAIGVGNRGRLDVVRRAEEGQTGSSACRSRPAVTPTAGSIAFRSDLGIANT